MNTSVTGAPTVHVNIPTALRSFTDEARSIDLTGRSVGEVLEGLAERYPKLRKHLFDDSGNVRAFVSVYLGDEDIRHLDGVETPVSDRQELSIVPSIAGG